MIRGLEDKVLQACRAEKAQGRAWIGPLKDALDLAREEMRESHRSGHSLSACKGYSRTMDALIRVIYAQTLDDIPEAEGRVAVLAMGGYGRSQLSPGSDVDLRFLVAEGKGKPAALEAVSAMVQVLWSLPFQTGQGCDTVRGTLEQMKGGEINILTSALESRIIAGNPEVFIPFREAILGLTRANRRDFARRVIGQREKRLAQYGVSLHIKEPNVKETAGGLRDYHTARWLLYLLHDVPLGSKAELERRVPAEDWQNLKLGLRFLTRVRNEIHLEGGRRDDRLGLDVQKSVAEAFGYPRSDISLPVESFMRDYYRHAKAIHRVSACLVEQALEEGGQSEKGRLDLEPGEARTLAERPSLAPFVRAAERGLALSERAKREIRVLARGLGPDFGRAAEVTADFRKLAEFTRGFAQALRDLHDSELLARLLPEFEGLDCFTQFDLYHHYTADEHTFHVVENLETLAEDPSPDMKPYKELLSRLTLPRALRMGLVFHDIAKWKKGDHSLVGAQMALEALPRLGFTLEEAETVAFLARQHLVMANLFQRRDVTEAGVAQRLAEVVGSVERLRLLTLLTFADIKAVGPGVWSGWKAQMLMELHRRTEAAMAGSSAAAKSEGPDLGKLASQVAGILARGPAQEKAGKLAVDHVNLMPARYFGAQGPGEIAAHAEFLSALGKDPAKTLWKKQGRYVELAVAARDALGLFSAITGCLSAQGFSILHCEAYVRGDGLVLDLFDLDSAELVRGVEEAMSGFERDLKRVLAGEAQVQDLIQAREKSRISESRQRLRVETKINFDNEASPDFSVLDVQAQDFLGLLHLLSSELSSLGLDIGFARIATQADRAVDAFYIREKGGGKIPAGPRQDEIRIRLEKAIAGRSAGIKTV